MGILGNHPPEVNEPWPEQAKRRPQDSQLLSRPLDPRNVRLVLGRPWKTFVVRLAAEAPRLLDYSGLIVLIGGSRGSNLMNIKDELLGIIDALTSAGIEYGVAGGLAVAIHGCPRLTVDIDVLIHAEDLDRARAVLAPTGFDLESGIVRLIAGPPEEERLFRLAKSEGTEFLTLDLLLATSRRERVWATRESFEFGGRTLWVISRDELIQMKRRAGRPKDLADIAALESELPPP